MRPLFWAASIADLHVVDVVERVEDPEHVDAGRGRLLDEARAPRCRGSWCSRRRWRRAAASGTARWGPCRRSSSQPAATGPRTGTGRRRRRWRRPTSPARTAPRPGARSRARRARVVGAQPRRQQRLVRVAPGGVGAAARACPRAATARCRAGPSSSRICLVPGGGGRRGTGGDVGLAATAPTAGGLGLPRTVGWPLTTVDAEVAQDARGAVAARRVAEQLRRLVDEGGVRLARRRRSGARSTFSRKAMLVFTPRMRNSRSARTTLRRA